MIWLSVVAFLVALAMGAVVLRWARRHGVVYGEGMPQRIHVGEVPRLGGVALLVAVAGSGGLVLGFGLNMLRVFGGAWVRTLVLGYTSALRFTPFLAQLFIVYYGLPSLGIALSPFQAAALTLAAQALWQLLLPMIFF